MCRCFEGRGAHIKCTDPLISFRKRLLQLLDRPAMGGFSITEFDFELVHAVLRRFQLFHLGAESVAVSQALVELGDLFTEDTDFLFQDFASLLGDPRGF